MTIVLHLYFQDPDAEKAKKAKQDLHSRAKYKKKQQTIK